MTLCGPLKIAILLLILMNIVLLYEIAKLSENCMQVIPTPTSRNNIAKNPIPSGQRSIVQKVDFEQKTNRPIILIWYRPFNQEIQYKANPSICGININCDITYDRSKVDKAGGIVFHYSSVSPTDLPAKRDPNQLYVWWTGERHQKVFQGYNDMFNMTFTYRRDSDVYAPYGSTALILNEMETKSETNLTKLLAKKSKSGKMAIWAVSNCMYKRRLVVAQELETYGIKLDKFGSCFNKKIENGQEFYDKISTYKFYFAFENAFHCKDYITEKFWFNGLLAGAVPVVFGAPKSDYEQVAPTNSFIHVDDFETTEELAKYLLYLANNSTAYSEYLHWRQWVQHPELMEEKIKKEMNKLKSFCYLCNEVTKNDRVIKNGGILKQKIVPSLSKFWRLGENQECVQYRKSSAIRYVG